MDSRRDNFYVLTKEQENCATTPSTKSPINLNGNFHYSFELSAFIVDHANGDKIMSARDFCSLEVGQKIFKGINYTAGSTELDTVLGVLEMKLSRTDTGIGHHQ